VFENVRHFQSRLRTPSGVLDAASVLEEAIDALSDHTLHYSVASDVVRAKQHAIPQDRERFIMIGLRSGHAPETASRDFFAFPQYSDEVPLSIALLGLEAPGWFVPGGTDGVKTSNETVAYTLIDSRMPEARRRYLEWIRQPAPGMSSPPSAVDAHVVRRAREDDQALIEKFAPGQRWMDYELRRSETVSALRDTLTLVAKYVDGHEESGLPSPQVLKGLLARLNGSLLLRLILEELELPLGFEGEHHLLGEGYLGRGAGRHGDWFERLSTERPSKTIVAHIGKDTYGYIHPYENRAISIREAARIQSFPDFYSFGQVGVVDGYSMIGDAVPPLLSHAFATRLAQLAADWPLFSDTEYPASRERPARAVREGLQGSLFGAPSVET
jgi:site-specific DNA-cytosine methylase